MINLYKTEKSRWILGLILILFIYTLFYLLFIEADDVQLIPRKMRHLIKFGTTMSVYLIGTQHLGKLKEDWMATIWHMIHISLLSLLVLIGAYDWIFGMVSQNIKDITASMQEFLISPLLYVAMGIINNRLKES